MYSGTIQYDVAMGASRLTAHLTECLRTIHARRVSVDGDRVRFRGGLFRFVDRWNVLVPFGAGELRVDGAAKVVHYRLSFVQLMITVTLLVGLLGCLMVSLPLPKGAVPFSTSFVATFCVFGWLALVGGNVVLGVVRFTTFLRRSIESVEKASGDNHSLDVDVAE